MTSFGEIERGGGRKRGLNETTGVAVKNEKFETKVSNVNK